MIELSPSLQLAVKTLRDARLDARDGLPEDLFLLVSSLVPLPNVDLLVTDESKGILLSRRNDKFFGKSWHLPGGCMRYGESLEECLQKTARRELGCEVSFNADPVAVRNVLRGANHDLRYPNERGHNVAILYDCTLPPYFVPDNGTNTEEDSGFLKWFRKLPTDFLKIQQVFDDVLTPWK